MQVHFLKQNEAIPHQLIPVKQPMHSTAASHLAAGQGTADQATTSSTAAAAAVADHSIPSIYPDRRLVPGFYVNLFYDFLDTEQLYPLDGDWGDAASMTLVRQAWPATEVWLGTRSRSWSMALI